MHEAAGLISIEGSLEGLPKEKEGRGSDGGESAAMNPKSKKHGATVATDEEESAAAAKAARKKARKAAKLAAKAVKQTKVKSEL